MEIDRGLYWNIRVEDVDRAQSDLEFLSDWTEGAAENLNEEVNEIVLGEVYADAHADNQGSSAGARTGFYDLGAPGSPAVLTPENVVAKFSEASATLTEHKVPPRDRWMVIPAWVSDLIFQSDIKNALITGNDQDLLRKGHIGRLATFDLYVSNQLSMVEDATGGPLATNIIFGHRTAITFANQLINSEVRRSERFFGDFARGLDVFGFNVNKPDALGLLYATRGVPGT